MSGTEIAALMGAIVGALSAGVTAIIAGLKLYKKAIREEAERMNESDRAKNYEEKSREVIAQKDTEIALWREQALSWQRLVEQLQQDPGRRKDSRP